MEFDRTGTHTGLYPTPDAREIAHKYSSPKKREDESRGEGWVKSHMNVTPNTSFCKKIS